MKKKSLVVLAMLLVCSVFLVMSPALAGEGLKTMTSPNGTYVITVPEKAPEFLGNDWNEKMIGFHLVSQTVALAIVENTKENMVVRAMVLMRKVSGGITQNIIAFAVSYDGPRAEIWYLDDGFLQTLVPSGRFSGPIDTHKAHNLLRSLPQRLNAIEI